VYGSKHSLKPRIVDVDAVGIGAIRSELRMPCSAIFALRPSQSQRWLGLTFQRSNCSLPCCAGLPSHVSYGPSVIASSQLASQAAWYIVSKMSLLSCFASADSKGKRSAMNASARPWQPMPIGRWRMFERLASSMG
jgi:hypothetical protein